MKQIAYWLLFLVALLLVAVFVTGCYSGKKDCTTYEWATDTRGKCR